jgi:NAD-dependent deacetylase
MNDAATLQPSDPAGPRDSVEDLISLTREKKRIVSFTGAGISTESGIPDYRGPNGVWAAGNPPQLGDFLTNPETRRAYWESRYARFPELVARRPNRGHDAIARMVRHGLVLTVITQNIDGLHQDAGTPPDRVIELHGAAREVKCLRCGRRWDGAAIYQRQLEGEMVPDCAVCGGPLRAATVLFGEPLPEGALATGMAAARACDLMLVVGSSLVVQPAAKLPLIARRAGAALAIVNLSETPLDRQADIVVREPAGTTLQQLADALLPAEADHLRNVPATDHPG